MPQRQLADDPEAKPTSPLRGLLIAVPLALVVWGAIAEAVRLLF